MAIIQSPIGIVALFQATVSSTASDVTGDGTLYRINYDNVVYDTANAWNNSTYIYTVPRQGEYAVSAQVGLGGVNDLAYNAYLFYSVGGVNQYQQFGNPYVMVNNLSQLGLTISPIFALTAGQTIEVNIIVSGGTKTVDVLGGSFLNICLVREFS